MLEELESYFEALGVEEAPLVVVRKGKGDPFLDQGSAGAWPWL